MKTERKFGPDLLRAIATLAILVVHMLNLTNIITGDTHTYAWLSKVLLRYFASLGVPLFLLLTGYLQTSRKIDKKHYNYPLLIC